jgi:hypothetical protein
MRFANPTTLRIGQHGTLAGVSYRVVGRVVLGTKEGRRTYYWNEFNLLDLQGQTATLVYEESAHGGQWRLFRPFEPQHPISASDASAVRIGRLLNLDGTDVRVTLLGISTVFFIEGQAPEGVEIGDVARYFNAEATDKMVVVSWTGAEVECFHGHDLDSASVQRAFKLSPNRAARLLPSSHSYHPQSSAQFWTRIVLLSLIVLPFLIGLLVYLDEPRPMKAIPAPAPTVRIAFGSTLRLSGQSYQVGLHSLVEAATVVARFEQHRYALAGSDTSRAFLVFNTTPATKDWMLYRELPVQPTLTPFQAAALRAGDTCELDNRQAIVSRLFQLKIKQTEGAELATNGPIRRYFGFEAKAENRPFEVIWDETSITAYRGETLTQRTVEESVQDASRR